ncbi:hypothetical protein LAZ67_14001654 [Cordylochernes scorpioides]|uniref:DUF4758 domain-containing protein n=1 Tax=Cordylochernes scorpioides TaxID=51811 RepID=A0ABY6L8V5_9ARAC|nr:hypothetical protein LAZ67_14001654 [Cordylochernes scorpioides]
MLCLGSASDSAPVYQPAEQLPAPLAQTAPLPTVTVRGFLNFKTTVDGTVIVFTPASETAAPASAQLELENEAQEVVKPSSQAPLVAPPPSSTTTTPPPPPPPPSSSATSVSSSSPEVAPYPTGLVTVLGGTHVQSGATTIVETKVIGTYIDGKYAQILQSTSRIIAAPTSTTLTPTPTPSKTTTQPSTPVFKPPTSSSTIKARSKSVASEEKSLLQSSFKNVVPQTKLSRATQTPELLSTRSFNLDDENKVGHSTRKTPPRRYIVSRRPSHTVRLNRFKVKLTMRSDQEEPVEDEDQEQQQQLDAINEMIAPSGVEYQKTVLTSQVTLHVGRRKSIRTVTITTSVPRSPRASVDPLYDGKDLTAAANNHLTATPVIETPGLVVTRTFTTTERTSRTSMVPVFDGISTSFHTMTESFFIMKIITAYKTMPPGDVTVIQDPDTEEEDPLNLPPMQTPLPHNSLMHQASGLEASYLPMELAKPLLHLGAALQQNPLAVFLGMQQLNQQPITQYRTITHTSTYVTTDTVYSTRVVSFYDGRHTRSRTLSESLSTTEKTMTSYSTTVEPYLNTQAYPHAGLQQLLGNHILPPPPPPQIPSTTITSTYTTVTMATGSSTRIYSLTYNAFSTKARTITSTWTYPTTLTITTSTVMPIQLPPPPPPPAPVPVPQQPIPVVVTTVAPAPAPAPVPLEPSLVPTIDPAVL